VLLSIGNRLARAANEPSYIREIAKSEGLFPTMYFLALVACWALCQDAQNLNLRVPLVHDMKTNMKEQTGVYPPEA